MKNTFFRAYDPIPSRQQAVDRLVHSEDDLRRAFSEIVGGSRIGTIRLGSDIVLSRSIALANIEYDVVIDGGGAYEIALAPGSSVREFFAIGTNNVIGITLQNLRFNRRWTLQSLLSGDVPLVRATTSSAKLDRFNLSKVYLSGFLSVFMTDTGDLTVSDSDFAGVTIEQYGIAGTAQFGSAKFVRCSFIRNERRYLGAFSTPASDTATATCATGSTNNASLETTLSGTLTESVVIGGGSIETGKSVTVGTYLKAAPRADTLTGANPALVIRNTLHKLTCTNTASGNITLNTTTATDGQLAVLLFVTVDAASTAQLTDGSGNFNGSANFVPTVNDTITLIYDSTTSKWVELSRSAN